MLPLLLLNLERGSQVTQSSIIYFSLRQHRIFETAVSLIQFKRDMNQIQWFLFFQTKTDFRRSLQAGKLNGLLNFNFV